MPFALETALADRADARLTARVVWIATAVASGLLVFVASASILDNYRRGYFADQDIGLQLFGLGFMTVGTLAAFALLFRRSIHPRVSLVAIAIHCGFLVAGVWYGHWYREQVVQGVVVRAEQAVNAIHSFERKYGRAPAELKALVPEFLATSPESLLEFTAELSYSVDPSTGAWRIHRDPIEAPGELGLDYSPGPVSRSLQKDERRIGNWIVTDCLR
jgi:hypothetical protein